MREFWQRAMTLTAPSTPVACTLVELYQPFFKFPVPEHTSTPLSDRVVEPIHSPVVAPTRQPVVEPSRNDSPSTELRHQPSLTQRLKAGLAKTRQQFRISQLFSASSQNADTLLSELETQLLMADVGMPATEKLLAAVRPQITKAHLQQPEGVKNLLRQAMLTILEQPQSDPFALQPWPTPFIVLMVGVNGVGKTTTLGKLSKQLQNQGHQVLLAAGDTFRAAAIEQLQTWGERNHIPVVAQQAGADAAAVIFDAISRAKARNIDVVLADTAGRLHNKSHLMDELGKMVRVIKKQDASAPHAILLVVDATTGQNAIAQAKTFQQLIGVTGIVLTKLDGTAKGGIAFALVEQLQLPICYIGVGEQVEDLKPFVASEFVDALLE
jgi:fused signal recognition particle receptor